MNKGQKDRFATGMDEMLDQMDEEQEKDERAGGAEAEAEEAEEEVEDLNALSPEEYRKLKAKKFGQRAVNDVDGIK